MYQVQHFEASLFSFLLQYVYRILILTVSPTLHHIVRDSLWPIYYIVYTMGERASFVWSPHIAKVRINGVRVPILLVVSSTGKINISLSPFAPWNLVSLDGFGSSVPRQPVHLRTEAESGAYLRDSSLVPRRRPFIYLNHHTPSGQSRVYRVTQLRTDGVHCRESAGTGPHYGPINMRPSFPHPLLV